MNIQKCRNPCKECPYKVHNDHNEKFIENVKMLSDNGLLENGEHSCHMIKPGWSKPNDKNICIGSIKSK